MEVSRQEPESQAVPGRLWRKVQSVKGKHHLQWGRQNIRQIGVSKKHALQCTRQCNEGIQSRQ